MAESSIQARREKFLEGSAALGRAIVLAFTARQACERYRRSIFTSAGGSFTSGPYLKPGADTEKLHALEAEAAKATGVCHKLLDRLIRHGE